MDKALAPVEQRKQKESNDDSEGNNEGKKQNIATFNLPSEVGKIDAQTYGTLETDSGFDIVGLRLCIIKIEKEKKQWLQKKTRPRCRMSWML